jgi:hypothetical protein
MTVERFSIWRDVLRDAMANDEIDIKVKRWSLAPLEHAQQKLLLAGPDDYTGRFFLALALAYNDLKGATLFEQYLLGYGGPAPDDLSEHRGQWIGMMVQLKRWIAGSRDVSTN